MDSTTKQPRETILEYLLGKALRSLNDTPADKRAPLIKEIRFIAAELDEIRAGKPEDKPKTPLDELTARRAEKEKARKAI